MPERAVGRFPVGKTALGVRKLGASFKLGQMLDTSTTGAGTFTALASGTLIIFAWGGGGPGNGSAGGSSGGGGGGAFYKRIPITKGQVIPYSVGGRGVGDNAGGTPGGDTFLTTPTNIEIRALGASSSGVGATAVNGDANRQGGFAGQAGSDGGGAGGGASGGGGQAGFNSVTPGMTYTPGAPNTQSVPLGGFSAGGGYNSGGTGGSGGPGRLLMMLVRAV